VSQQATTGNSARFESFQAQISGLGVAPADAGYGCETSFPILVLTAEKAEEGRTQGTTSGKPGPTIPLSSLSHSIVHKPSEEGNLRAGTGVIGQSAFTLMKRLQ